MGITKFGKFIDNYDNCRFKTTLQNISSLFIDCNGIFHKAKGEVYKISRDRSNLYIYSDKDRERIAKQNPKDLEKKHIKLIIEIIEGILRKFRPTDTLILAPDGMAPVAKMQQQKERRYDVNEEEDKLFMGASISPGTEFMINLDTELRKWLAKDNQLFPKKVIYSSHMMPGEGEHKIFDCIRNRDLNTAYGNHVVYGADGDLFIISLFSPMRNIYLYHEDRKCYYSIDKLKKLLTKDMNYNPDNGKVVNPQLIRDFCFLTYFIGNDFLHRMPNLYDTQTSMKILMDCYRKNAKNLTNFKNEILWKNLVSFLKILRDYKIEGMTLYEFSVYSGFTPKHNKDWQTYPQLRESMKLYDLDGNQVDANYDPKLHSYKLDMKAFTRAWYDKQFKPHCQKLRDEYKGKNFYTSKDVQNMCKYYCKTLQWCLHYYNRGDAKINKMLFYPFHFTPLIESLINYLEHQFTLKSWEFTQGIFSNSHYSLSPIHQLMLILAPANKALIPSPFRELYVSKLASICPEKFITLGKEGTDANHVKIKLIPPVNPFLVKRVVDASGEKIPEKYSIVGLTIIEKDKKEFQLNKDLTISQEELI